MAIPLEPSTGDPRDTSDAIAELYGRYGADLFRLAYRLTGTKEDAEDVVHDVFVGLPEKLERYEERGRLDAWLRRVTARVALMRLRSGRRRPTIQLERVDASSESSGEPQLDLQAAVDGLPSHLRSVLVLKEIEGYSHAEIADMLGISGVTSRVRLLRAMRKLRRILGGTR
jgi:RNA polymerase sigma-70 factor, ECF subfamily